MKDRRGLCKGLGEGWNIPYLQPPSPSPPTMGQECEEGLLCFVFGWGGWGECKGMQCCSSCCISAVPITPPTPGVPAGAGSTAVRPGRPAALISASVNWAAAGREKSLHAPPCPPVLGNSWALKLTWIPEQMGFLLCRTGDPQLTAPAQKAPILKIGMKRSTEKRIHSLSPIRIK